MPDHSPVRIWTGKRRPYVFADCLIVDKSDYLPPLLRSPWGRGWHLSRVCCMPDTGLGVCLHSSHASFITAIADRYWYIGLPKMFIWLFPWDVMKNPYEILGQSIIIIFFFTFEETELLGSGRASIWLQDCLMANSHYFQSSMLPHLYWFYHILLTSWPFRDKNEINYLTSPKLCFFICKNIANTSFSDIKNLI